MKLFKIVAAGGLALATLVAAPALAQPGRHETTVREVHGPLRVLPHHKRKVCQTRMVNHRRVRKCYYR